jgi:glycosyltransferase involved in cell wall biosynthesis
MVKSGVVLLTPSQAAAASYVTSGLPSSAVQVLANGIDLTRFQSVAAEPARRHLRQEIGVAEDEFLIGVVCRLEPVKNLPKFFAVVAALSVKTVVVGNGSQSQQLANLIATQGWQERIRLVGSQRAIPAWLAAFDLLVLPSLSESFGLAVAEALLMQTPVVATRVGGIPELTGDGAYATLVAPNDSAALQAAIQWVQAHYAQAKAQAIAGQAWIQKNFSIAACGDQLHAHYQLFAE